MSNLLFKEKLALIFCVGFASFVLITGIYDFLVVEQIVMELVATIGVFLLLVSAGLKPKVFFLPLSHIAKSEHIPTLGDPRVQRWLGLSGFFLCLFSVVWWLLL